MKHAMVAGTGQALVLGDRGVEAADRFRRLTLVVDASDTGRAARGMVAVTLTAWELGPLVDDVRSCVAELVGNVREHAFPDERSPLRRPLVAVTLRLWPGLLVVEVADEDATPPMLPEGDLFPPEFAEDLPEALLPNNGRGLHIVRCLSDFVWWAPRDEGGKSVFCRFDLEARSVGVFDAAAAL